LVVIETAKVPEPDAKKFEGKATRLFELRDTPKGQLIILRPLVEQPQARKNLDVEGFYVTGDYSNLPPSIKFTKEPEKYSYWKVPLSAAGPLINFNGFKKPAYLSVDPQIIKLNYPLMNGHLELLKVNLSLEPKDQFKAEKIEP